MATLPGRETPLLDAVNSIAPQVDRLVIWANNFVNRDTLSQVAQVANVTIIHSDVYAPGEAGDIGDIGKFYFMDEWTGYVITVDDTWIYPANYVEYMIKKVDQYKRKAVITIHGRALKAPMKSYYFAEGLMNLYNDMKADGYCNTLGTGVMALHSDVLADKPISLTEFAHTNMTDIYMGIALMNRGIPQVVAAHTANWVMQSPKAKSLKRISTTCCRNEETQLAVVNSINWEIHKP